MFDAARQLLSGIFRPQGISMSGQLNTSPNPAISRLEWTKHRKRRGITLEQISDFTKISTRFLRAIEEGEFENLPGGIYSTSYIRQYAAAIDFEAEEILALYHTRMGPWEEDLTKLFAKPGPKSRISKWSDLGWLRAPTFIRFL